MSVTLRALIPGNSIPSWTALDLDLQGDRTDLVVVLDRGSIVRGTLRDSAGTPLPDTNFGVVPTDPQLDCTACNGRTDSTGRFAITVPTTTVRFRNWPQQPGDPDLFSPAYAITGDVSLDPVLSAAR